MSSFRGMCCFCLSMVLGMMLVITIAFDFGTTGSWVASSFPNLINQPSTQIATMNQTASTLTPDIESQGQEAQ